MIKILMVGIWVCLVLAGSAYYFSQTQAEISQSNKAEKGYFGGLDYVKLDPITVAIIREKSIRGYLIIESVFTIKQREMVELSVPVEYLLRDLIIGSTHANPDIDIFQIEKFDLISFQNQLLKNINDRLGKKTIHDVLIQKIDFISKEDIRDLQLRRS